MHMKPLQNARSLITISEYNKCGQFTSDNDETSIGAVASITLFKLNTIFPENEGAVATEDDQKWQRKQITPVAC